MKDGALLEGWKCVREVMISGVYGMKGGEEAINIGVLCDGMYFGVCGGESCVCVSISDGLLSCVSYVVCIR